METTFGSLIYESDGVSENGEEVKSNESSRRGRRSTKSRKSINIVLTENVRRSSRISTKFNASVEELKTNATVKTATRSTRATKKIKVEKTKMENKDDDGNENGNGYENRDIGKIVGATEDDGKLKFVFKWNDRDELTLLSSDEANLMYPYIVIDFYESCMVWETASDSEEDHDCELE